MRKLNQAGIDLIKSFEGLKLAPYLDSVNVPTIGYGTTYYEDGKKVTMQDPAISQERAEELLAIHAQSFCDAVEKMVKVSCTDNQFAALVSFAYNLGSGNLGSSTLLKKLNAGDYAGAANEFEKWNKAGGQVLAGLTRRRQAEKALFMHSTPTVLSSSVKSVLGDGPSDDDINVKLEEIEKGLN